MLAVRHCVRVSRILSWILCIPSVFGCLAVRYPRAQRLPRLRHLLSLGSYPRDCLQIQGDGGWVFASSHICLALSLAFAAAKEQRGYMQHVAGWPDGSRQYELINSLDMIPVLTNEWSL